MKNLFNLLKKVVLSFAILYTYNLIAVNFNMVIPINVITILSMAFFGVPALITFILFKILVL